MDDDQRGLLPQQLFSSGERVAQEVGEFLVRSHIGQGAMGQVFLVEHKTQGGLYALKLLPIEMVSDEESLTRFAREAEALQALSEHPAIVTVYGTGRTKGGAPYYVMDYVDGRTLKRAFQEGLPLGDALSAIEEVADALAFAHGRGLIHRDLKPDNVLLDREGRARLVDFGLVRAVRGSAQLTQAGQALGTPAYMAPEQTSSEEAGIGPWTDVWGLGVLVYEALTGRTPYTGASALEIYTQLYESTPIATPRALGVKVSPKLEGVVMRALEHQGSQRFADAGQFLAALRAARPAPGPAAAPKPRSKAGLLIALAAMSLVLLVGALYVAKDQARLRRERGAALAGAEDHVAAGRLDEAEALLTQAEGARGADAERLRALRARLAKLREERQQLAAEVEALFAKGEAAAAYALAGPGAAQELGSPSAHWILALGGDYAAALAKCPAGTGAAERARLAAWAGDQAACEAALATLDAASGRAAALRCELQAYLPGLSPPEAWPAREAPWANLAEAEEALARGDAVWAAIRLSERPGEEDPALRLAWTIASARVAMARADRSALGALAQALLAAAGAELSPLERGRALAWAAWLGRLAEDPEPAARLERYAPGVPLARALRGEPSPWYGECQAGRVALAAGDQARAKAAFERAGATKDELRASPLAAWRALAARGRAGPVGLLVSRARGALSAAAQGPQAALLGEAQSLLEVASALAPEDPLVRWGQSELARGRGLSEGSDAEALLNAAPADPAALLELARALGVREEKDILRVLKGRIEGGEARPFAEVPELEAAYRAALASGGAFGREAGLELLEVLSFRRSLSEGPARAALQKQQLALAQELLQGVELAPVLAARAHLVQALRAGDAGDALLAAGELSAAGRGISPERLAVLRLRSSCGDEGASDAARAYLALVGDLPAFTHLRARIARGQDSSVAIKDLDALLALGPRDPRLILSRELAGMDPAAPPLGGSADSLLALGEVVASAPEATTLVLRLLRARVGGGSGLQVPGYDRLQAPGRPLEANLARALLACALLPAKVGDARLDAVVEALASTQRALAAAPGHAAAHLLRAEALGALPAWARGRAEAELASDLRCARGALPWAAAPVLAQLQHTPANPPDAPRRLIDELLAQGFLTRKSLPEAVFGSPQLQVHQTAVEGILGEVRAELASLKLRHHYAREIGMTSYELAVRAYSARLPLTALSLRLRTGADTAFDSVGKFEGALEATIPAEEAGQRARVLAEYKFWRALQVNGDPSLRDLSEEESDAQRASRKRLWLREAGLAALKGLEDRPGGQRLQLPRSALEGLGPVEALEKSSGLGEAVRATQPESCELWGAWRRRWDPTPTQMILRRALTEEDLSPLSAEDLERPFGWGQGLLWGARRACVFWAEDELLEAEQEDELVLLFLRAAAFERSRPPDEVFYWTVRSNYRLHEQGPKRELALLARDLFRAARILTDRPSFFAACEGDALIDLAAMAEGEERAKLAAEALALIAQLDPTQVAPHLESEGSAWWRVARAKVLAGDLAGAEEAIAKLKGLSWSGWWGLREGMGDDPAAEQLKAAYPALDELFKRFRWGRGEGEGDEGSRDERRRRRRDRSDSDDRGDGERGDSDKQDDQEQQGGD